MTLTTPVQELNKVGKTIAGKLQRMGITTVRDLLFHFPFRYEDYSQVKSIRDIKEGETVTVKGTVELIANRRARSRRTVTEALVSDGTATLRVIWFNQPFITKVLSQGKIVFLSGTVKRDMLGNQLVSPAYELESARNIHTARLVPMYPLTEGLTQKQVRFLVQQCMPAIGEIFEWLPEETLKSNRLIALSEAMREIHFPASNDKLKKATDRLKFDELILLQLKAELSQLDLAAVKAPALEFHEKEIQQFVKSLPFTLTKDQKVAAWEILKNISGIEPMNRLLSGDVGSGKTVVAALALYNAVLSGYQGIFMAPTEILAAQHLASLTKLLPNLRIALVTRTQRKIFGFYSSIGGDGNVNNPELSKKELLARIANGEVQIIIGTHALISEKVEFNKVGLVIVDEQHRFGVAQRRVIKEKAFGKENNDKSSFAEATDDKVAHFLSMTATPIPRSLALAIYGDLDVSQIRELPVGRKPILTRLVETKNRDKAYEFIREQVKRGRQVFVICPLIENATPGDEKRSVMAEYKKLSEQIFPELRVGYLHGKIKEKDEIMNDFKGKKLDILVSTSVIEVGVDVPNASVMMIEGAERFGLAQLHQFRGRVGRGSEQSYCFLFTGTETQKSNDRLKFFESHQNGFELAEKDLELRGPGEVYGTTQSGMMQLRLAKLTDVELIKKARDAAREVAPKLGSFPALKEKMEEWERSVHLE